MIRVYGFHPRIESNPDLLNTYPYLVYAIYDGECKVKIGKSSGDPRVRLKSMQTGNARELKLLAYTSGIEEGVVHRWFGKWRVRGEWFWLSKEVWKYLCEWDWLDEGVSVTLYTVKE